MFFASVPHEGGQGAATRPAKSQPDGRKDTARGGRSQSCFSVRCRQKRIGMFCL